MDQHEEASGHVSRRGERRLISAEAHTGRGDQLGLDEHLGFRLRLAYQRATANLAEEIGAGNLTPVQFATLLRLHERGPLSQNELGRSVGMPPANIHAQVRRLVGEGLLTTRPATTDRRLRVIELTSRGRSLLLRVLPGASAANARMLSVLSDAQQRTLMDLLARLAEGPAVEGEA